jgi:hypothetical protein
MFII